MAVGAGRVKLTDQVAFWHQSSRWLMSPRKSGTMGRAPACRYAAKAFDALIIGNPQAGGSRYLRFQIYAPVNITASWYWRRMCCRPDDKKICGTLVHTTTSPGG